MDIKHLIDRRYDLATYSNHPEVQEMIDRFKRNEELDCESLDSGDRALIGAVYMDATHNPDWHPTPYILALIAELNAKMGMWASATRH